MRRAVSELREEGKSQEGGKRAGGVPEEKRSGGTQVGAQEYFIVEEAWRFNWNPDVEPETGKPIDAPNHKDQEHSF
jgi:hypothetical protein